MRKHKSGFLRIINNYLLFLEESVELSDSFCEEADLVFLVEQDIIFLLN